MRALLARELREAVRSRWFVLLTIVFAGLALGVSYLSWSGASALGFAGFNRTVASLLNLMLLFVPLMGLLLGALGLSGEREDGTLGYVLAQPVSRRAVYAAQFAGQWGALGLAIGLGLGVAGLVLGWRVGPDGAAAYGVLAGAAVGLAAASLACGTLLAVVAGSRMRALAAALCVWVVFAFVLDSAAVGLVVAGRVGPVGLFWLSLANPVQSAKVCCLLALSAKLEVLGPSGVWAVKTFGASGAAALAWSGLALWTVLPAAVGAWAFRRLDVR